MTTDRRSRDDFRYRGTNLPTIAIAKSKTRIFAMHASTLNIKSFDVAGAIVTSVTGRVDGTNALELEKALMAAAERGLDLLMDCGELDYLSSAGLRAIIVAAKALKASGRSIDLCAVRPHVLEAIKIAGFDRLLRLHGSDEAYFVDRHFYLLGGPEDRSPLARNKLVVLRYLMMLQFKKLAGLGEVISEQVEANSAFGEFAGEAQAVSSLDGFRRHMEELTGEQDIEVSVKSMIAEGDRVAVDQITTHHRHDGTKVSTHWMSFYRLDAEKIVEVSHVFGNRLG